jgi:hypothetical protein
VVAGGIVTAALVAGPLALGAVRTSRPATASTARPTSTIATVATRRDATRMLPPMRLGPTQPTIPTDVAGHWKVHPDHAIQHVWGDPGRAGVVLSRARVGVSWQELASRAVGISWPMSAKNLAVPMPRTPGVS